MECGCFYSKHFLTACVCCLFSFCVTLYMTELSVEYRMLYDISSNMSQFNKRKLAYPKFFLHERQQQCIVLHDKHIYYAIIYVCVCRFCGVCGCLTFHSMYVHITHTHTRMRIQALKKTYTQEIENQLILNIYLNGSDICIVYIGCKCV